ncbi:universal stress protein [Hyperthermus butylicus]|uniref:universal stress protein n=1 Tax=Hyperthermus butylicus TaxID=54248 RepID=UPI001E46D8B4|nr:universal stress protein [Hyperthermus butylicus]
MESCSFAHAVVGLDLSSVSDLFVPWLSHLRRIGTERLTLVHIIPIDVLEHVASGYLVGRLREEMEREALSKLEAYAAELRSKGFNVEVVDPEAGVPAQKIAEVAQRMNADYIVVASRGRGWIRRILLGGTAEELVHVADRPIFISKPYSRLEGGEVKLQPPDDPFRGPILAAIDFGSYVEPIVCRAREIARRTNAQVVLLHVLEEGEDESEVSRRLTEIVESLAVDGVKASYVLAKGKPGKTIVEEAKKLNASLVLIGPHNGNNGLHEIIGTTAETVIRRTETHVLVCK